MKIQLALLIFGLSLLSAFHAREKLNSGDEKLVIEICKTKLKNSNINSEHYDIKVLKDIITVKELKRERIFRGKNNYYYNNILPQLKGKKFVRVYFYPVKEVLDGSIVFYIDPNTKEILRIDNY